MREAKYAGMFYPSDQKRLQLMIDGFLSAVDRGKNTIEGDLKAIIVPHAGYVFSGQTASYAYDLVSKSTKNVILIGPSHHVPCQGIACSSLDWQTPFGTVDVKSVENELVSINDKVHENEHSLEVQLPFIQHKLGAGVEAVMLATNGSDVSASARMIEGLLDSESLLVISTDLSHFYDEETAKRLDDRTSKHILEKNLDALDGDEACGLEGVKIAVELARRNGWSIKELHRSTSADVTGDKSKVVGYGSYALFG